MMSDPFEENDDSASWPFQTIHSAASSRLSEQNHNNNDDNDAASLNTEFFALPGVDLNSFQGRGPRQMMCSDPNQWDSPECNNQQSQDPDSNQDVVSGMLHRQSWVVPMLAFAAVNVAMIIAYEIYILCKATRNTPSRRHLFLGQMLLLGLFLGSLLGFAYSMEPTDWMCIAIRFGTGIAYALIYSSLLVKLVFLISLNTGVYLPATYQALLFLFCMIVQFAIGIQWLSSSGPLCDFGVKGHLLTLLYIVFLILFSSALAIKARHFRDNYREAKYIGGCLAITLPIWISWVMASLVLNESLQLACTGFGLLSCCAITFIIMFLPKSRQLSAIGKEGIFLEDQDDRYSLPSDHYSPSFYHFKPQKTILGSTHPSYFPGGASSPFKDGGIRRSESPVFRPGNSYTGLYSHADLETSNIYSSLQDPDRTKSVNPNVYFYKTNGYKHPGFIY